MEYAEKISQDAADKGNLPEKNAATLAREITWFSQFVNQRLTIYFPKETKPAPAEPIPVDTEEKTESWWRKVKQSKPTAILLPEKTASQQVKDVAPPDLSSDDSVYAEFVKYYKLTAEERFILILTLIPHVQPHVLDVFLSVNKNLSRGYTEFGGLKASRHSGFLPTVETALFLLAGNDLENRFRLYSLFEPDHFFSAHNILQIDAGSNAESFYSAPLAIGEEYIDFFTTGNLRKPQFSMSFPAKRVTTKMDWADLVVDDHTAKQLDEIRIWLQHGQTLYEEWGMAKKIKPGYKVLFHGSPGTGKTLTASLLGKIYQLDVYRIDLSMVISKYIGETEKNLEQVFRKAENKNWILFFDEADALFGKRTNISDSHDKYANQEIAYLLTRLEDYPGLIILASNMRQNVDEAFTRRLQSVIHFQRPQPRERFLIWKNAFSAQSQPPAKEELERIAQQFDLSGGSIMNVVQFASLMALSRNDKAITVENLLQGIKKELKKEGKTM